MCDSLKSLSESIAGIAWLDVIQTLAPLATAIIAFCALQTWKKQDKAKREVEFLDALIEEIHCYIAQMSTPIALIEIDRLAMKGYEPTKKSDDQKIKGAIAYIEKNGQHAYKRLCEALETVQPSTIRLRSLIAKGQVFKFENYAKCHNAVAMITWQFDRIEAFAAIIGSSSLNWSNTAVLKTLENVLTIQADDIRNQLEESNVAILEFTTNTYSKLYD